MKLYQHVLFWVGAVVALTFFFGRSYGSMIDSFFFVSMLLPVVVGTCYFFNYFLVPRYLLKGRKWKFALHTFYMLIISLYLEMVVITVSFIVLANYKYANMGPLSADIVILAITLYLVVFVFSFILLVKQFSEHQKSIKNLEEEKEKREVGYLTVRADRKQVKIAFDEIQYVESLADYVKIHIPEGKSVITRERITNIGEKLPEDFLRIHRSFIVNKHKIESFNKEFVVIGEQELPISRSYKPQVVQILTD